MRAPPDPQIAQATAFATATAYFNCLAGKGTAHSWRLRTWAAVCTGNRSRAIRATVVERSPETFSV
jgi:hypothetical protein